jgi:hypothetical protein
MIESRNVQVCVCGKCGREFVPLRCPSCKSPNWNKDAPSNVEAKQEKVSQVESVAPIEKQSPAEAKPKKQAKEKPTGKSGYCPHKFIVLDDGTTACKQCNGA